MGERKTVTEMKPKEMERARMDENWVCPICGPTTVAPVDFPIINDIDGSDVSPPHCVTCGTAVQPGIPLVDVDADRFHGQVDHLRHQASNFGVIDLANYNVSEEMKKNG